MTQDTEEILKKLIEESDRQYAAELARQEKLRAQLDAETSEEQSDKDTSLNLRSNA